MISRTKWLATNRIQIFFTAEVLISKEFKIDIKLVFD
tara:strand:+ start:26193 stop:26303 length:111 start_codon:yes stop_codon:yes gene_type:complete